MLRRVLVAALPMLACAVPTPESNFITHLAKRADSSAVNGLCNVNSIQMDSAGLPAPSPGLILEQISIGRGTQNYTCANSTDSAVPVATGAVATLFNVTCLAGPYPDLLNAMTAIALRFPTPSSSDLLNPANLFLSGHHYFTDSSTPFFNFNTASHSWGMLGCRKLNSTTAAIDPATNVPNLKLETKSRDGTTVSEVYRLKTQGGQPPKTCKGAAPAFQVQYSAEYWFWASPGASLVLP